MRKGGLNSSDVSKCDVQALAKDSQVFPLCIFLPDMLPVPVARKCSYKSYFKRLYGLCEYITQAVSNTDLDLNRVNLLELSSVTLGTIRSDHSLQEYPKFWCSNKSEKITEQSHIMCFQCC